MRLVFDAKNFNAHTGVPNYVMGFLEQLHRERPELEMVALSPEPYDLGRLSFAERRLEPQERLRKLPPNLWLKFCAGRLVRKDEIFFAGSTLRPLGVSGMRTCAVVHDLNHLLVPQTMTRGNRWAMRIFFAHDVRTAGFRICNSQGTSTRLHEHCGVTAEAVVTPLAQPLAAIPEAEAEAAVSRLGLGRFLLFVGTPEPRKNLPLLLEAFSRLRRSYPDLQLALAGGRGWGRVAATAANGLRPLGFADAPTLYALYRRCACFVFPSLYEGFGMPVLEARHYGARVVCTDLPELHEAGGKEAIYVRPDVDSLCDGLERALRSPEPLPLELPPAPELPPAFLAWLEHV